MAELRSKISEQADNAVLLLDGAVVGGVTRTAKDAYTVDTSGRISALDGITGSSVRDALDNVVARVRQGGVKAYVDVSTP
jgi:hypothetical protein